MSAFKYEKNIAYPRWKRNINFYFSAVFFLSIISTEFAWGAQNLVTNIDEGNQMEKTDLQEGKRIFASVTMVDPDVFFRQRLNNELLSKWGCKYDFVNEIEIKKLISYVDENIKNNDIENEVEFDARYKIEFYQDYSDRGVIVFGPNSSKKELIGFISEKVNPEIRKVIKLDKQFLPILFNQIKNSDGFESEKKVCDKSIEKYSKASK